MASPSTKVEIGPLRTIDLNEVRIGPRETVDFSKVVGGYFPLGFPGDGTVQDVSGDPNDPRGTQIRSYDDQRAQDISQAAAAGADGKVLEGSEDKKDKTVQEGTEYDDFAGAEAARNERERAAENDRLSGAGDNAAAQNIAEQRRAAAAAAAGNSGCVSNPNGAGGGGQTSDLGFNNFSGNVGTGAADPKGVVITPELLAYLTPSELEYAQAYGKRGTSHPGLNFLPGVTGKRAADMPAGSGVYNVQPGAMARLIIMKNILGGSLTINSAWRSPIHNANIKGAPNSNHKRGTAFDITANASGRAKIIKVASALGFMEIISYPNSGFVHVALSSSRRGWSSGGADSREVTNALNAHKLDAFRKQGLGVGAGNLADKSAGLGTGAQ